MKVAAKYSFNNGATALALRWQQELDEIYHAIAAVDAKVCRTKISREKTMPGKQLNEPKALNREFKRAFEKLGWANCRVACSYSDQYYRPGFKDPASSRGAFREMDFVKNRLGLELQFRKCASVVCSVCAKMTIFHNLGHVDAGVEIVAVKHFADQMSTGVSSFEQFVWDLEKRGVSNIDLPVLIIGVDA